MRLNKLLHQTKVPQQLLLNTAIGIRQWPSYFSNHFHVTLKSWSGAS